jgi:fumarate reductase flavoprotein subunit
MGEQLTPEQLTSGLVVVGAGGAGLPAALAAQEKGVHDVIVLEKRPTVGGNAGMSGGFLFAAASEPQLERGISYSPDALFRETMAHYRYDEVDARLIRLWIDEADRNVEWLKSIGVGYRPWFGDDPVVEPSGWSNHPGTFQRAMEIMRDRCIEQGGRVLTGTPATAIEPGDRPGWHRVRAKSRDGEIVIDTPRVLLASGGFTGNVDLLHEKFPGIYDENIYWTDAKRLAGDGIPIAAQAGGDVTGRTFLIKENCYSFKTKKNRPNRAAHDSTLWVNRHGERFLDESLGQVTAGTNALLDQPGMMGYALFDDVQVQQAIDRPAPFGMEEKPELRPGEEDPNTWTDDGFRRNFREQLTDPANSDWCIGANSWAEIAEWIGADAATLEATVEEHNRCCEQGRDELWGKPASLLTPLRRAPFYVLRFRPLMIDTSGPVRVDRELRVVDADGHPVPGLFAAGALVAGWIGNDEHRFGTPLSWAIGSGRIAGEHAARCHPTPTSDRKG